MDVVVWCIFDWVIFFFIVIIFCVIFLWDYVLDKFGFLDIVLYVFSRV